MIFYHELLGIKTDATEDEIKLAYRRLMRLHHPDRHGDQEDPISRLIIEAYAVLSDGFRRQKYVEALAEMNAALREKQERREDKPKKGVPKEKTPFGERQRCIQCQGLGYNQILGLGSQCRYCKGNGWVPAQLKSPGPEYRACLECRGHGFNLILGLDLKCYYCKGAGWLPGKKF